MKDCLFIDKCPRQKQCEGCQIKVIQDEVLRMSNIPAKYRGLRLEANIPPTVQGEGRKNLLTYMQNLAIMEEKGINMLIYPKATADNMEGCGTGKTTIACALGQEYIRQNIKKFDLTPLALFINAEEFADLKRREATGKQLTEMERYTLDNVEKAPFLIIDDLGAEKISDFTIQSLYGLINTRINNPMITIYTTNLSMEGLQLHLGERLYSRIASSLKIETSGKDLRQALMNSLFG